MTLSQRLRKIRRDSELNQKEFADSLGMTSQRISELERGKLKNLKPDEISKLKEIYNVDTLWLTTGEGKFSVDKGAIVGVNNGNMTFNTSNFNHGEEVREILELFNYAPPEYLKKIKERLENFRKLTDDIQFG